MGFPGINLSSHNSDEIEGWLLTSENLTNAWGVLDELEGEGYTRYLTDAILDNGTTCNARIYALSGLSEIIT